MKRADRIKAIPPYVFAELNKKVRAKREAGADVIDLGIGDPDSPTPDWVVERLAEAARDPSTHHYPPYEGDREFNAEFAAYYRRRFGVTLDPTREVYMVSGSKEGIAHLIWAFVDPGDFALIPDPAYPVYRTQTLLAGGIPFQMPLTRENGFVPDLARIPEDVARRATIMFLNFPGNPTASHVEKEFFKEAVAFAKKYDIALVHDAAYVEMTFDGYVAPSVLEVDGAKEIACEFYSMSKPFNMTGWRMGACVGNEEIVYKALGIIKTNTDSGHFVAAQKAGIEALRREPFAFFKKMNELYARRRDALVDGLRAAGWDVARPKGTFYVWLPVPPGYTSADFAMLVLEKANVVVVPGTAYGQFGEGYVRIALTVSEERLREAVRRMVSSVSV
ncbi:MAG: LL-diaminopimelate aminotransferase [Firmicutes bacterium]|nr:LL-diaminopimelate aminotransferase [Bacillota bacterium]